MSDAAWLSSPSFHYNTLHNKVLHSTWPLDGFSDPDFELSSDSEPAPEDGTTLTRYNPEPAPAEILYVLDHDLEVEMTIEDVSAYARNDDVRTPVSVIDPCGFCGQSGHPAIAFSLGAATNSSKASPSTNAPICCQLCPASSGDRAIFWKYNVHQHITSSHDTSYDSLPTGFAKEIEISQLEKECLGIPPDLIDNLNSVEDNSNATTTASSSQNSLTKRRRQTLQGNTTGSKRSKKA
ncbi:hypothetical protein EDB19DRAFT_2047110 [Suillus lakei]|nr:hypothetical protein EDB19DRAFT_2047110 [Suillus lakei]